VFNFYNNVDYIHLPVTMFIVLEHYIVFFNLSINTLYMLSSYVSILLWIKLFENMRSFQATAFYVRLISQTFTEMAYFLLILIFIIIFSGFTLYVHDINYTRRGILEYTDFFTMDNKLFSRLPNAIISQYLLTLGEFELEDLQESPDSPSGIVLFIIWTFIIQIVLLNMLIAIMSETFEQVMQQQRYANMKETLSIITEYGYVFKNVEKNRFIFLIDPINEDVASNGWQGRFTLLIKAYQKGLAKLQKNLDMKIRYLSRSSIENRLSMRRIE